MTDLIEFTCPPEDYGVIAEPFPARQSLPKWFKDLPPVSEEGLQNSPDGMTIKRCMPFFDVLATGWIIPVPAEIRVDITDNGQGINTSWKYDKELIASHQGWQVGDSDLGKYPLMKFINFWKIKTPPGISCLFYPPIERDLPFECLPGIVDTDTYDNMVQFPALFHFDDGTHFIKKGTPMVQIIPFQRNKLKGEIRSMTLDEISETEKERRNVLSTNGWYRDERRSKNDR